MKTANDLKVGDVITNISTSSIALTARVEELFKAGAYVYGIAEILTLRRGVNWSELITTKCRFKYNKRTNLEKIIL